MKRRARHSSSPATAMEEHWQAGYEDTKLALGEPGVFELPHVSEAARIFDVHRGWMK